ncbi:FtsX-like permease family protein [Bifidobacterium sp. H6bp22N]|uniref:ABC transporter permease n=1 Tax=Bifidobacterium polysaccharolyticum TaxID=2750967 RepID=UPI0028BDD066|nr:FtsX-like permease family protein [Bifidobacterium sp. H6bp22N]MDT7508090.1 FtsX-like permease family protein [Bifidobacterium sp. H6bp22N]
MLFVARKMMRHDLGMMVPAGIAIVVGTVFIAMTFLFGNTMDVSMRRMVSSDAAQANYAIIPAEGSHSNQKRVKDFKTEELAKVPGVHGVRSDTQLMVDVRAGKIKSESVIAIPMADSSLMPVGLSKGSWPSADDQVVLPGPTVSRLKLSLGDKVSLNLSPNMLYISEDLGPKGQASADQVAGRFISKPLTLSGVSSNQGNEGGEFGESGGAIVLTPKTIDAFMATAGLGEMGNLYAQNVYLNVGGQGSDLDGSLASLRRLMPSGYSLEDRHTMEDRLVKTALGGSQNPVTTFLLVFGTLAMFVAATVIANTFQVMVARQRRYLALLRTIGANKSQVRASVLIRSIILGAVASLIGVGAAIGIMAILGAVKAHTNSLYFQLKLTPAVILVPLVFGIVVTILASLNSSWAATRVSPLEALRPADLLENKQTSRIRLFFSVVMILSGITMTVWSLWQVRLNVTGDKAGKASGDGPNIVAVIAVIGIILAFLGILLSANRWIPFMLKGIGSLVSRVGPSSTIAVANIARNHSRVAATGTALLIGVTLVATLVTGAASAKQTMADMLDEHYSVDLQISADGLDAKALNDIRRIDGVAQAELVPQYAAMVKSGGENGSGMTIFALDAHKIDRLLNSRVGKDLSGPDALLLPESLMDRQKDFHDGGNLGLNILSPIQGDAHGGSTSVAQRLFVTSIYAPYQGIDASNLYGMTDSSLLNGVQPQTVQIWAKVDGSPTVSTFMDKVKSALSGYSAVSVKGGLAEKQQWDRTIDSLLMIILGLLAVAVAIALIGVANTLSLSVLERRRESATLRAIGMTRKQIRRSLAVESGLIALGSSLSGMVLGLLFGWAAAYEIFSSLGTVAFPIPWSIGLVILLVALVAAILASVLPARRVNRTPPVVALAEE